jgi:hypothetical protein
VLDVTFLDRAVLLPPATLVVADLHVGRADAARVEAPLGERADLVDRLADAVAQVAPETVVFAGDVLHEFGRLSRRSRDALDALAATCRGAGATPVFVAGNHDGMLPTGWDGPVHDRYRVESPGVGSVVVCHGHERPPGERSPDLYVVGHDHPAITIEGQKRPCFLYGADHHAGADLLMLPAFSRVASGVAVNRLDTADFQSPLVGDVDALRPVVWDEPADEALWFPPLGRFRRLL